MKIKVKALAAALPLLAAVQANAAINDDGALSAQGTGNGSGELFLSVIDRGGSNPESYVRDLGVTANQFVNADSSVNNAVGTFNFSADSNLTSLLSNAATNGGTIHWNIAAAYNGDLNPSSANPPPITSPFGVLTTAPGALTSSNIPSGYTGVAASLTQVGTYLQAVNGTDTNYAANNSQLFLPSSSAFYDGTLWGSTQPLLSSTTEGAIGSSLGFYFVYENPNIFTDGNDQSFASGFNGVWSLANNGNLTFAPVPLPPAVWLLGSALVGLVGVGRRRGNAAV